jgi:hypothetical protein
VDTIDRSSGRITFTDRFPLVQRVTLFLFGLLPLSAPYELLILPSLKGVPAVFAFIPVLISLASLAVSILFIASALFGSEQSVIFDAGLRTIIHRSRPGLAGMREQRHPFGMVARIDARTHEWSDGPPSHNIVLGITKGPEIAFGRFGSKDDAERHLAEVAEMLGVHGLANKALPIPH